jgi:Zn-dependent alcohol dehydrogenase
VSGADRIKAAVCHELGRPLVVEEVEIAPPRAGEVRVRIAAVAICASDVHLVRGDWVGWSAGPPLVAGHEAAGVVSDVGVGVTAVRPGDRVAVTLIRWCGRCGPCAAGAPYLCEGAFALATEHRLRTERGLPLAAAIRTGAFAESVVVDQSQAVRIPDGLPLDRACLLACGVITGVGAVLNTARVAAAESVVVIGAGGVGLSAVQGARLAGAGPIVAADRVGWKLEAAAALGATHTANTREQDVAALVGGLTGGRGADHAFVTVGDPAAVTQAVGMLRRGGTAVLVGMPAAGATAPLAIGDFVWNGQRLLGSSVGSTRPAVDIPRLAALYGEGRLRLDELITGRYPLERINEAIASMEQGEALRNVIVFP